MIVEEGVMKKRREGKEGNWESGVRISGLRGPFFYISAPEETQPKSPRSIWNMTDKESAPKEVKVNSSGLPITQRVRCAASSHPV